MLPPEQDLERRRPVWEALADLFLDTELDDRDYRHIADRIVASGYTPAEVHSILWDEVFAAVEINLRQPAGECWGVDADWLQERILNRGKTRRLDRVLSLGGSKAIVRQEWTKLLHFLPDAFRGETHPR
jgi:hypothetical protein